MIPATAAPDLTEVETGMLNLLEAQRADFRKEGTVSAASRIDRLDRGIDALVRYADRLAEAINSDYGCRPREITMLTDIGGSLAPMKHAKKHLTRWMKAEKRPTGFPFNLVGGRSRIEYQPLGVVGIIAPWNFPVSMVFAPMSGALAAGNRVMLKPSEFTPATSEVLRAMIEEAYDPKEVVVCTGGSEVGQEFSSLPLDHLFFTGATSVARHIMAAAARNLVPVTLELGGKSPVIISRTADLEKSLGRIMVGKTMNAGQICVAPDYLLVPEEKLDEVINAAKSVVSDMYPSLLDNAQYTSIINERHFDRLNGYLAEVEARGVQTISINPSKEDFSKQQGTYKIPPTLIVEPLQDLKVHQEEIFGPLLPIHTYSKFSETIDHINSRPSPLAAYYFGSDAQELAEVEARVTAGGMCINDVSMHVSQEDLPFGGVGSSGMGSYHGIEGFRTFSHAKSIYRQAKIDLAKLGGIVPPYGKATEGTIKSQVKK